MSDTARRVRRAFRDHDAFDPATATDDGDGGDDVDVGDDGEGGGKCDVDVDGDSYEAVKTPFDGVVTVGAPTDGAAVSFTVEVRVPTLDAVTVDEVADVVEEGWFETFALRVRDVGGVTRGEHDQAPTVTRAGEYVVVEATFTDSDPQRGVDDASALVNFVEGTYVQGIVPGYEYVDPVAEIISRARQAGGDGGPSVGG